VGQFVREGNVHVRRAHAPMRRENRARNAVVSSTGQVLTRAHYVHDVLRTYASVLRSSSATPLNLISRGLACTCRNFKGELHRPRRRRFARETGTMQPPSLLAFSHLISDLARRQPYARNVYSIGAHRACRKCRMLALHRLYVIRLQTLRFYLLHSTTCWSASPDDDDEGYELVYVRFTAVVPGLLSVTDLHAIDFDRDSGSSPSISFLPRALTRRQSNRWIG